MSGVITVPRARSLARGIVRSTLLPLQPGSDRRFVLLAQMAIVVGLGERMAFHPWEPIGPDDVLFREHGDRCLQAVERSVGVRQDILEWPMAVLLVDPGVDVVVIAELAGPLRRWRFLTPASRIQPGDRPFPPARDVGGEILECPLPHRPRLLPPPLAPLPPPCL